MGTPHFASYILEHLLSKKYQVVGVVTVADKPAGRGKKLIQSPVKEVALKHQLPLLQPLSLKEESFLTDLKSLNADVFVVIAFRMLPKVVWNLPPKGTFNLHASLLPEYRGAAPINWAIIRGETKTGVTTFFIDEKIDTGSIIDQIEVNITHEDTAGSLHDKLQEVGSELVCNTLNAIENGSVQPKRQPELTFKEAPKLFKDNSKIDWTNSAVEIYNTIRGLNPYPTAWTYLNNRDKNLVLKIYSASYRIENHNKKIGTITTTKESIEVAVKDGYLLLSEIQLPGKRKMNSKDLLNGFTFSENANVS